MLFDATKVKQKKDIKDFVSIIGKYRAEQIECTLHTFVRLSQKQRKIFTCDELKRILMKSTPFLVGIQYNDNYAVFYKHNGKNLRIMLVIEPRKVKIVTFYYILEWQIPKM